METIRAVSKEEKVNPGKRERPPGELAGNVLGETSGDLESRLQLSALLERGRGPNLPPGRRPRA
jgi:hypothetical protein